MAREIDGLTNLDDFDEEFGIELPDGPYETVAGFMINRLGRLPCVGDGIRYRPCDLTVVSMDGRRIDRVLVAPLDDALAPG